MRALRCLTNVAAGALLAVLGCKETTVTGPPDPNPLPAIFGATPNSVIVGATPPLLTLTGTGFLNRTRGRVSGSDRPTTFVSDTLIRLQLLAEDVDSLAVLQLTVVNPEPGGGTSGVVTIAIGYLPPTIASIDPDTLDAGSGTTTITLRGTGFHQSSRVLWNGFSEVAKTFVSPTEMRAVVPAPLLMSAYFNRVTVFNPGVPPSNEGVVLTMNPTPVLTAVDPDSIFRGSGSRLVTVRGSGFKVNAVVRVNGTSRSTTLVSGTELRFAPTSGDIATVQTLEIRVANPEPSFGSSASRSLKVVPPPPTIARFEPAAASVGGAAMTLAIFGTDFLADAVVDLAGVPQPTTFISAQELRVDLPATAQIGAGTLLFRVRIPSRGTSSIAAGFPVLPPTPSLDAPLVVEIPNNHLVADPVRAAIYMSVPASNATYGNRIVRIDPGTGAVTGSVVVGSEPNRLAISDDGQFLYVGLDGAASVIRVRLADLVVNGTLQLPSDAFLGSTRAEDLEVVPGNARLVAVSTRNLCCSPRHMGVLLFADTTRLPAATQGHTGSNRIAIANATELWGYNNETTDFGFRRISIENDGLREIQSAQLFQGFGVNIEASGSRAFSNTGTVVSPTTMTVVGTISGSWTSIVRPDVATSRVHLLDGGALETYNWSSLLRIGSALVPDASGLTALIRWGADGLAMGGGARLVIVRGSLVGP